MLIPGSHGLLEYNATHRVLICRKCQYAIQKSALRSHLLRHKIYRAERHHLLSSIAQLALLEPRHVPIPSPASPPIDALPVISGYRCTAAGCENLCASSKRMRRHGSEIHSRSEPPSLARPVKLQTFFRGTKLRYFEVTLSPESATAIAATPLVTDSDNEGGDASEEETVQEGYHEAEPAPSENRLKPSLVDFDLRTLTYFHHFTTTTSLTLPKVESSLPATCYWQTDLVRLALRHRWLMCGLLAISACHLAVLAQDSTNERAHREQATLFLSGFSAGLEEAVCDEEAKKAGEYMRCVLCCALPESESVQESPAKLPIILANIRNLVIWGGGNHSQETFAQTGRFLREKGSSDAESTTHPAILNRLRELPFRMAETFGKPENIQAVLATLSAIAALVECCDISFASNETEAAWRGMAMWLTQVPDLFNHMVSQHDPAALVVLTHWAPLVERAACCGYWFLKGSAKIILREIAERLPVDDYEVQRLVGSLVA